MSGDSPSSAVIERDEAIARVRAHDAGPFALYGPPGIGKTAVLGAAFAGAKDVTWIDADAAAALDAGDHRYRTVVIDDEHRLSPAAREAIVRACAGGRIERVYLAGRREVAGALRLPPLGPAGAERIVRRHAPLLRDDRCDALVRAARGVPFVLVAGALTAAASDRLTALLERRLDRETPQARSLVQLIAAIDEPIALPALAAALDAAVATVLAALDAVSDLVEVTDAGAMLRLPELAGAVRAGDPAAPIAARRLFDTFAATRDTSVRGLSRLRAAARRCGERRAFGDASAALATRLSRELRHAEAATVLAEAYAEDPELDGRALVQYFDALRALGQDERALALAREAFADALARGDGAGAARFATSVVHALATLDRPVEAEIFLREALQRPAIAVDPAALADLRAVALMDAAYDGDVARFEALAPDPATPTECRPLAYARALRGDAAGSDRAMATWRAAGMLAPLWDDNLEAHRRLMLGGPAALRTWWDHVGRERVERDLNAPAMLRIRAFALIADGAWDDAAALLDTLDPFGERVEYRYVLLEVGLMLDALRGVSPRGGRRTIDELRAALGAGRRRSVWASLLWWCAAGGHDGVAAPADVTAFIEAMLDERWPSPVHLAALPLAAVRARDVLGMRTARAIVARAPRPGSAWLSAHADLAAALLDDDARALIDVRDRFDALCAPGFAMIAGMALPAPRAREAELAERTGYRARTNDAAATPLSPRERDVAMLVAAGASNREIAQRLSIAERTVETHLTTIYRKLGVASRVAVAARFRT